MLSHSQQCVLQFLRELLWKQTKNLLFVLLLTTILVADIAKSSDNFHHFNSFLHTKVIDIKLLLLLIEKLHRMIVVLSNCYRKFLQMLWNFVILIKVTLHTCVVVQLLLEEFRVDGNCVSKNVISMDHLNVLRMFLLLTISMSMFSTFSTKWALAHVLERFILRTIPTSTFPIKQALACVHQRLFLWAIPMSTFPTKLALVHVLERRLLQTIICTCHLLLPSNSIN